MTTEHKPHSGQEIVNILKAGMPWPEPSDGGWHWEMPPVRSMEKARKVLGEVQGLVEQLEALRKAEEAARVQDLAGNEGDADAIRRDALRRLVSNPASESGPSLREQLDATRAALDRGAADYVGLLEQLEAAQERLTAYETPGWINSVQKVMEERRRAERAEEQLETALARAEAAEAFIVQMDMSYRYEEFRERHASSPATGHGTIGPWKYDEGRDVLEAQAEVQFPATRYGGLTREEWAEYLSTKGDSSPATNPHFSQGSAYDGSGLCEEGSNQDSAPAKERS